MADKTNIGWTDATWNVVTGCEKVSAGCRHCCAEREWVRLSANPTAAAYYGRAFDQVRAHPERLTLPLSWTKPRMIFVTVMGDLFHEAVPDSFIDQVFAVMALAPQHTFQVLTKRPARMHSYMNFILQERNVRRIAVAAERIRRGGPHTPHWLSHHAYQPGYSVSPPLPNVWLGVTAENQEEADRRVPLLLETPAAVRWVSAEPLLGPVDLSGWTWGRGEPCGHCPRDADCACGFQTRKELGLPTIDWVVAGGESGPKARPMHPDWARGLRDQCAGARVPFFFKQWGEFVVPEDGAQACRVCGCTWHNACEGSCYWAEEDLCSKCVGKPAPTGDRAVKYLRVGRKVAGDLLDQRSHKEYPTCR